MRSDQQRTPLEFEPGTVNRGFEWVLSGFAEQKYFKKIALDDYIFDGYNLLAINYQ